MARPVNKGKSRASRLYCDLGPSPAQAVRVLGVERASKALVQWKAWRDEYGKAYEAGLAVPPPPFADECDVFARPAA